MPAGCSEDDSGIRALSKDQQKQKPHSCQESRCIARNMSGTHPTAGTGMKLVYGNDSKKYYPLFLSIVFSHVSGLH